MAGTFTVVGIAAAGIIIALFFGLLRRRRRNRPMLFPSQTSPHVRGGALGLGTAGVRRPLDDEMDDVPAGGTKESTLGHTRGISDGSEGMMMDGPPFLYHDGPVRERYDSYNTHPDEHDPNAAGYYYDQPHSEGHVYDPYMAYGLAPTTPSPPTEANGGDPFSDHPQMTQHSTSLAAMGMGGLLGAGSAEHDVSRRYSSHSQNQPRRIPSLSSGSHSDSRSASGSGSGSRRYITGGAAATYAGLAPNDEEDEHRHSRFGPGEEYDNPTPSVYSMRTVDDGSLHRPPPLPVQQPVLVALNNDLSSIDTGSVVSIPDQRMDTSKLPKREALDVGTGSGSGSGTGTGSEDLLVGGR